MQRITEYLKERNIPEDSLEANSILEGYELGAERTKREMIEKAVEWLKEEMYYRDQSSGRGSYGEIKALGTYDSLDEFINDFKQAMEE
jgi:hypothetical protein